MILTESNAEPFLMALNVSHAVDLPAGTSVYSKQGWQWKNDRSCLPVRLWGYVFVGAMFFRADFLPDPDTFAAKVANQFMFGAQLGWFSLGGRSNSPQTHLFDLLMDPKYDAEILYLKRLSSAKAIASDYFNHGFALRNLDLIINGTKGEFGVRRLLITLVAMGPSKKTMTQG